MGATIDKTQLVAGVRVYTFRAEPGSHISNAINESLGILQQKSARFPTETLSGLLTFNDLEVPMQVGECPKQVQARYQEMSDKRRAEYEASDEYKEREAASAKRAVDKQKLLDETVQKIEELCAEWKVYSAAQPSGALGAELFGHLIEYIDGADLVGIEKHAARVRTALESVGYQQNEYVGHDFTTLHQVTHQQIYRAFYAGQALDMMGMIHPGLSYHIKSRELHLQHP